jgi:formate-dependent nitrite reductase membrane component NrfD
VSEASAPRQGPPAKQPGPHPVPGTEHRASNGRQPGNGQVTGDRRWRRKRRAEQEVVPRAEFTSYYGRPVIKPPVWEARDIAGYLFLGGLAGGSSLLAAGADLTGRQELGRAAKAGACAVITLSLAALVHDLGRPARFVNMMRVFKVTSPMSVGTWLLSGYAPAAGLAAVAALTGGRPRGGAAPTAGSALLGPAVAAYTAALVSDTAVPAWHDGYREMPFVFTGSAAMAAGGLGLLAAPAGESGPARNLALLGAAMETAAVERMTRRIGMVAEPYHTGRGGAYMRASRALTLFGAVGAALSGTSLMPAGRPRRIAAAVSGAALIGASAATRWGVFHAGMASARDPKYTVVPQRQRLTERTGAEWKRVRGGRGRHVRQGGDVGEGL